MLATCAGHGSTFRRFSSTRPGCEAAFVAWGPHAPRARPAPPTGSAPTRNNTDLSAESPQEAVDVLRRTHVAAIHGQKILDGFHVHTRLGERRPELRFQFSTL